MRNRLTFQTANGRQIRLSHTQSKTDSFQKQNLKPTRDNFLFQLTNQRPISPPVNQSETVLLCQLACRAKQLNYLLKINEQEDVSKCVWRCEEKFAPSSLSVKKAVN